MKTSIMIGSELKNDPFPFRRAIDQHWDRIFVFHDTFYSLRPIQNLQIKDYL